MLDGQYDLYPSSMHGFSAKLLSKSAHSSRIILCTVKVKPTMTKLQHCIYVSVNLVNFVKFGVFYVDKCVVRAVDVWCKEEPHLCLIMEAAKDGG